MKKQEWHGIAKRILKAQLVKQGISNKQLAEMLNGIGIKESKTSIDSKISRGSFSAVFLIQCLYVIGCTSIALDDLDLLINSPLSTNK